MNKRQAKKDFRKCVCVFPVGKFKHGRYLKKKSRQLEKELLEKGVLEKLR